MSDLRGSPSDKSGGSETMAEEGRPYMIRVGIIGTGYGCDVLLPAFRTDERCKVVAIGGRDPDRTLALAHRHDLQCGEPDEVIADPSVDAVAIAVPPHIQAGFLASALDLYRKPVFAEKPFAASLSAAQGLYDLSVANGIPVGLDFNVAEFPAFRKAKQLLEHGAIGKLRSLGVTWCMENRAIAGNLDSWKTDVLGNFASHTLHYLEWLFGPVEDLSCALAGTQALPDAHSQAAMLFSFQSGLLGSAFVSCAAYGGRGHSVEVFGEEGALRITNEHSPYQRRFELYVRLRGAETATRLVLDDTKESAFGDPRIAASARLVTGFLDAVINKHSIVTPGIEEGLRVQTLIEAARRAHNTRSFVSVPVGGASLASPSVRAVA